MVSVIKRMRKLRALLAIRVGPGAAMLPPEVTRIHMDFAINSTDGHGGPRKFWRACLPRLKFHNPAVPMTVNRTTNQEGPALMTIHFTSPEAPAIGKPPISSTTSSQTSTGLVAASTPPAPTERTEIINMKHRKVSEILTQLMEVTKAREVQATAEEMRQIQQLQEQREKSEKEAEKRADAMVKKKREEAIMAQARGAVDAARQG